MKVKDVMSTPVIRIHDTESVAVAARTLTHYNIGVLPVCGNDERVCGVITDRDIVTRCMASAMNAEQTTVRQIMTPQVLSVTPETDVNTAAQLMGRQQVRRLPVVENNRLCGMVSLGDLANSDLSTRTAAHALTEITGNISHR